MKKERVLPTLCVSAYSSMCLVSALQAQTFTDVSQEAGFLRNNTNSSWAGVWADYDNDGFLDVITAGHEQEITLSISQLWHNDGNGHFTDVTRAAGMNPNNRDPHGCLWADFDNDEHVDLFVCHGGSKDLAHENLHELYRNRGNGTFTNIARASGASGLDTKHHGRGGYGVDYDGDGRLDIYSTGYSKQPNDFVSVLFRNTGGFHFTETAATAGLIRIGQPNRMAPWADFDGDGLPDVLIVTPDAYDGRGLGLYKNKGDGTFTNVIAGSGLPTTTNSENAAWADYNNDGKLDLYISQSALRGFLFRNNGNGTFTDVTTASGLINSTFALGLTWGDSDNDGDQDLYIVNVWNNSMPNRLFRNNGDGSFTDITASAGVGAQVAGNGMDGVFVDYNDDGFLDLFVTNGRANSRGPYVLLQNNGNGNHWLKIKLVGTGSNRDGIMTKLKVFTGGSMQFREYTGPQHLMSQSKLPVHFGLGSATLVDRIELTWPSGTTQQVLNVAADQTITIVESSGAADLQISKTAPSSTANIGAIVTYTILVGNNGPQPASNVVVTDNLPPGMTFASCTPGGGGICGGAGATRTITFASLASNQAETISLAATIDCSLADGAVLTNTATVLASTADPSLANNSSTSIVTAMLAPPLTITACAADRTIPADATCEAAIPELAGEVVVSDNCTDSGPLTISQDPIAGTLVDLGETFVTITVTDGDGYSTNCTAKVTVADTITITTCAADKTIAADDNCRAAIPDLTGEIVASDNCPLSGSLTISQEPSAGTYVGPGETLVTITVTDVDGNSADCTARVTVLESTAPAILTCAGDRIISANSACQAALPNLTSEIVASDSCTPTASLMISQNPVAGTMVTLGETFVTITVVDGSGNSSNCTALVTVVDTTAPIVTCPANIVTNVPGSSATVNYANPSGTDNCSSPTLLCTPAAGSSFPQGTNTITCTATDAASNNAQCTFKIIVKGKPTVTITAPDATASEPGTNKGKFEVRRTGPTGSSLKVYYTVSGTATSGSDYNTLSGSVSIPSGSSFKTITVTPRNDSSRESTETVGLTLTPKSAYIVGAPNNATVSILDND